MNPSRFRWGLLFIVAGVLLLLNSADKLHWDFWRDLAQWWPVLLIAIGLEKLFSATRLKFLAFIPPLLLAVGIIYLAVSADYYDERGWRYSSSSWEEKYDPEIEAMDIYIDLGPYDLNLRKSSTYQARMNFDRFVRKPEITYDRDGSIARINVENRGRGKGRFINYRHYNDGDWDMSLNGKSPVKLKCEGDGSKLRLNLTRIMLEQLDINNPDGVIDIDLGSLVNNVSGKISGDDSRLSLTVPEAAGLKIDANDYAEYFDAIGMNKIGNEFVTDNFNTAGIKIKLELDEGLRHLSINRR